MHIAIIALMEMRTQYGGGTDRLFCKVDYKRNRDKKDFGWVLCLSMLYSTRDAIVLLENNNEDGIYLMLCAASSK